MPPQKRPAGNASTRQSKASREPTTSPDPYASLLAEYAASEASNPHLSADEGHSRKRRRIGDRTTDDESVKSTTSRRSTKGPGPSKLQIVYTDFEDDASDSDDDDADFEDVVLPASSSTVPRSKPVKDLKLVLDGDEPSNGGPSGVRRKVLTAADRKLRLDIHKMHVLALLAHTQVRNSWCNDTNAQASLRMLIPTNIRKWLIDDPNQSQFQRTRSIRMGVEKVVEIFAQKFEITARGMSRSYWTDAAASGEMDIVPDDIDLPIEKADFVELASTRKASRDVGTQLFCAMLRSLGLEVRLVCSLQPLPLQATMKAVTPVRPKPTVVPYHDPRTGMTTKPSPTNPRTASPYSNPNTVPQGVRRFGHAPNASTTPVRTTIGAPPRALKRKKIEESSFPTYWVEVFDIAAQKWFPVDPLVLRLVDKPTKYEPPANDTENSMSYVVAFDEDGYAKDVTRRYAHAYNAKTRRNRVESTRDGARWWKQIMRRFKDPLPQDRDQVEDAELTAKEGREPMPRNIVEFKNHPYYALERHIRRNEVIHPKRQVGNVSAGVGKTLEPIYRRGDVHLVRSADAWFRAGRQIKIGEEPLKYVELRRDKKGKRQEEDEDDDSTLPGMHPGTPLYANYQTQQYIPPPIFAGIVPKNIYGNIDIYTPSMIPAGAVWINHPFAGGAARLLKVDWADAVTGFEFRGRTGTAVTKGVVVAAEYHDAILETIYGFQYAFEEEETSKRTELILRAWKKFLIALRIRQRISNIHVEGEEAENAALQAEEESASEYEEDEGGGFFPGQDVSDIEMSMPAFREPTPPAAVPMTKALEDSMAPIVVTWGKVLPPTALEPAAEPYRSTGNVSNINCANTEAEGFMVDSQQGAGGGFILDEDGIIGAGGFMPEVSAALDSTGYHDCENDLDQGGGFMPEDDETVSAETPRLDCTAATNVSEHGTRSTASMTEGGSAGETDVAPRKLRVVQPHLERKVSSASSAADSLISHDPDDDDAEPEWL